MAPGNARFNDLSQSLAYSVAGLGLRASRGALVGLLGYGIAAPLLALMVFAPFTSLFLDLPIKPSLDCMATVAKRP